MLLLFDALQEAVTFRALIAHLSTQQLLVLLGLVDYARQWLRLAVN